jgi:hypothetical protein
MALRRWSWLWGPAVAALVLAIGLLPPGIPSSRGLLAALGVVGEERGDQADAHRDAVQAAVSAQRRRLREQWLADSLVRAARGGSAVRSADGRVTVVYERPVTRDSARVWLSAASAEFAFYPKAATPGVPVVVALLSNPARNPPQEERYLSFPTLVLRRAVAHSGACVVVVNLFSRGGGYARSRLLARDASGRARGQFLDTCALYGRFGVPGAAVAAWVDRGDNWYWGGLDQLVTRVQEAGRPVTRENIPLAMEYSRFWSGAVPWRQIGCLRGAANLCAQAVGLEPRPEGFVAGSYFFTRGQTIGHLLVRGTPAQFASFWRSPLPPAQALQAAYGEPAGKLAMAAFRHWSAVSVPGGPRAEPRLMLGGLLWAGAALALALFAGRRWQTES